MSYAKRCSVFCFLYSPIHTLKKILSTSECNWGYRPPIEIGIVSEVSSRPQLALSKISTLHAPSPMSYAKRCSVFCLLYSPIHTLKKILSTSECNWGYRPPIEMGIVSEVSLPPQLALSKIST